MLVMLRKPLPGYYEYDEDVQIFKQAAAMREEKKEYENAKLLKKIQTLLLILHHSARCRKQKCKYSYFKKLWEHMEKKCSLTKTCKVRYCAQARDVINHYRNCKEISKCKLCRVIYVEQEKIEKEIAETTASEALMLLQGLS